MIWNDIKWIAIKGAYQLNTMNLKCDFLLLFELRIKKNHRGNWKWHFQKFWPCVHPSSDSVQNKGRFHGFNLWWSCGSYLGFSLWFIKVYLLALPCPFIIKSNQTLAALYWWNILDFFLKDAHYIIPKQALSVKNIWVPVFTMHR